MDCMVLVIKLKLLCCCLQQDWTLLFRFDNRRCARCCIAVVFRTESWRRIVRPMNYCVSSLFLSHESFCLPICSVTLFTVWSRGQRLPDPRFKFSITHFVNANSIDIPL